jgi:hypothetical protein
MPEGRGSVPGLEGEEFSRGLTSPFVLALVVVLVIDFDRHWLGERKANQASVGTALARQSRESITRTSTSTIEEIETLARPVQAAARRRAESYGPFGANPPKQALSFGVAIPWLSRTDTMAM